MNFDTKIETASGNKDVRNYLNGVYLDSDKGKAIATDGHILAVVPFESEFSGTVPIEAVKLSQKKNHGIEPDALGVTVTNCESKTTFSYLDGTFPNYERVIPTKGHNYVTFNADLLARLQKALTLDPKKGGVKLYLPDDVTQYGNEGMYVESTTNPDAYGVIMPMRG